MPQNNLADKAAKQRKNKPPNLEAGQKPPPNRPKIGQILRKKKQPTNNLADCFSVKIFV